MRIRHTLLLKSYFFSICFSHPQIDTRLYFVSHPLFSISLSIWHAPLYLNFSLFVALWILLLLLFAQCLLFSMLNIIHHCYIIKKKLQVSSAVFLQVHLMLRSQVLIWFLIISHHYHRLVITVFPMSAIFRGALFFTLY